METDSEDSALESKQGDLATTTVQSQEKAMSGRGARANGRVWRKFHEVQDKWNKIGKAIFIFRLGLFLLLSFLLLGKFFSFYEFSRTFIFLSPLS